jgi:sugar lactone lactonase YvrE
MQYSRKFESARSRALRRGLGALLICSALVGVAAPAARAASGALWIADADNGRIDEYLPSQLKSSHTPTPLTISISSAPYGACFDKSNNLWVIDDDEQILGFTAAELKKLPTAPSPTVTITSSSFKDIVGCAFDKHGNLWLADLDKDSLDEISAAQLKAGGSITPAVIITDSAEMSSAAPGFVTFDKSGNLWTDGRDDDELFEFSASQLSSGGDKTAAVVLKGGGSLGDPGQIGFDGHGNLWVSSYDEDTVVEFPKRQISTSNNDAPAVTISSSSLDGPWGLAFHGSDLWVLDYGDGNGQEFISAQIKGSGSPAPKVLLTGAAATDSWGITFGPAFGKLH